MSDMMTTFTAKGAELLSLARELVPTFRKRAAEAEKLRRIPPESIDDLRKAGLFRTLQPAVLGGYELPLDEAVLITATVAEGCGSTGWVQGVYSDHCATLGMFNGQAQKDVWGRSPDSLISSGFMPTGKIVRVGGGYRLSGRWSFSSGCDYADWALVRSFVPAALDTDSAELYMFLVPKTDYTIIDNWFVMGMSATGSKDFQLKDEVFVPEHRALSNQDLTNGTGPGSEFNGGDVVPSAPYGNRAVLASCSSDWYRRTGTADLCTGHAGEVVRRPQGGPGKRHPHACCELGR